MPKRKPTSSKKLSKKVKVTDIMDPVTKVFDIPELFLMILCCVNEPQWILVCKNWLCISQNRFFLCSLCKKLFIRPCELHTELYEPFYKYIDWRYFCVTGTYVSFLIEGSDITFDEESTPKMTLCYYGNPKRANKNLYNLKKSLIQCAKDIEAGISDSYYAGSVYYNKDALDEPPKLVDYIYVNNHTDTIRGITFNFALNGREDGLKIDILLIKGQKEKADIKWWMKCEECKYAFTFMEGKYQLHVNK